MLVRGHVLSLRSAAKTVRIGPLVAVEVRLTNRLELIIINVLRGWYCDWSTCYNLEIRSSKRALGFGAALVDRG